MSGSHNDLFLNRRRAAVLDPAVFVESMVSSIEARDFKRAIWSCAPDERRGEVYLAWHPSSVLIQLSVEKGMIHISGLILAHPQIEADTYFCASHVVVDGSEVTLTRSFLRDTRSEKIEGVRNALGLMISHAVHSRRVNLMKQVVESSDANRTQN